jgi:hypothetical protein
LKYKPEDGDTVFMANEKAQPQRENTWKAEYLGSGTFIIHKPKRQDKKRHQTVVKNPRRGMRKG